MKLIKICSLRQRKAEKMKKTLLGLFLVLGAASFANSKIEIKGAWDMGGKYYFKTSSRKAKGNAGEVGAEYRYEVIPGLELGAGSAYQFHSKLKQEKGKLYNSVPIYATAKYSFDTNSTIKPYVKGDLGYSINTDDAKDGLYYGVGGGIKFNNLNVDVMYKENKGKYTVGSKDYKADYRRVALGVGYDFNLGY